MKIAGWMKYSLLKFLMLDEELKQPNFYSGFSQTTGNLELISDVVDTGFLCGNRLKRKLYIYYSKWHVSLKSDVSSLYSVRFRLEEPIKQKNALHSSSECRFVRFMILVLQGNKLPAVCIIEE
jgi:hypothetical protein